MSERVWIQGLSIATRNADGGHTVWSETDALLLHKELGDLLQGKGSDIRCNDSTDEME